MRSSIEGWYGTGKKSVIMSHKNNTGNVKRCIVCASVNLDTIFREINLPIYKIYQIKLLLLLIDGVGGWEGGREEGMSERSKEVRSAEVLRSS